MPRRSNDSDRDREGRRSPSPPRNPNVFDDEYALDPDEDDFMPSVSDGFRPAGVGGFNASNNDLYRQDHHRAGSPRPPLMTTKSQETELRRIASRNSTMKSSSSGETITNDTRQPTAHARGPSTHASTGLHHRESISSTGSFATMARSESPFTTGPSHPYGMYTQTTMARSPSVTTSSTQAPHRSLSLSRPTHPYGMYTQNPVEDDVPPSMPAGAVPTAIPVGFPGHNGGYHRRFGPDGEEQDIIGPDGHTEQLPPYTRYPAEGPTKAAMAAEANATPVDQTPPFDDSRAIPAPLSPPISLTQPPVATPPLQEHRQSVQRRSVPATAAALNVSRPISTLNQPEPISEKEEKIKNTPWRKRKLWGRLPMGVAAILLVLVLIFAIILGAAIGTFVTKKQAQGDKDGPPKHDKDHEEPSPQVSATSNALFDATPIPTPSNLPPLPNGAFALPLGIAQESTANCLTQVNQFTAWSCKMSFAPLVLTVENTEGKGSRPLVKMEALSKPDGGIQYGVQPPVLSKQPIAMQLVVDLDYKAFGPAFHFDAKYDKVVVLNENDFAAGKDLDIGNPTPEPSEKPSFRHRFQVYPGDEPWFCFWNETYIEGYIYAQDNSSAATFSSFPTAWPTQGYGTGQSGVPEPTMPPEVLGLTGSGTAYVVEQTPAPTPASQQRRRRGDSDFPRFPPYPRIVKIEERRLPGSPQPYCQKMHLYENGQLLPLKSSRDLPIIVQLQEDDPTLAEFLSAAVPLDAKDRREEKRAAALAKRRDPPNACHCQWMFQ